MVKVCAGPSQPLADGVTVIVAVKSFSVVFVAVKAGMFPVPEAANPMEVLLFVQLYTTPATAFPVKFTAVLFELAQIS